jgi:translocation and assembly module TamB
MANFVLTKKMKVALAVGLVALIALGFWWNSLLGKMASAAQAQLVTKANEHVNGKVTVGKVEFSFFGTLNVADVTVTDRQNAVAGKSARIAVRFGIGDVLAGRADLSAVKSVTLEDAVVTLASGKDGRWNWEDIIKTRKDQEMVFRGSVAFKQGTVLVRQDGGERKLEAVNGTVDFARYPALAFDMTAKSGSTPFAVKGSWATEGEGEVAVKTDQASLADVPLGLLGAGDMRLSAGTAKNVTVTVRKKAGKLSLAADGTVEKLAATVAGYALSEGAGKVSMADGKVALKDASVLVNGQKLTAGGTLTLAEAGLALDLDLAAAAFDPAALAAAPLKGAIAFQAKLTGTPDSPKARGTFTMAQGSFGDVAFANGRGNFTFAGGTLTLSDTQATAWDGTLSLAGDIVPATKVYRMMANGRNVDAAQLSEKDIHGRANFDARLNGQGSSGGQAAGSFTVGEGKFSGIPFLSMTGDFVKQGEKMTFQNVVVNTVGGSFRAEGSNVGSAVKLNQVGAGSVVTNPAEAVTKSVTDKVGTDLKKKLFGK